MSSCCAGRRRGVALRIGTGEDLIDRIDVVGDALRLAKELLGLADRLLKRLQRRIGQAREIPGLVDEGGRLVLQAVDLIVDLLQCPRCGQHVLAVVARIEHRHLGARRNTGDEQRDGSGADREQSAKAMNSHGAISSVVVSMSAAQSRPLPAKPGGGEACRCRKRRVFPRWPPGLSWRTRR